MGEMSSWKIKAIRQYLNWTQEKFAQEVGVSWITVSRWENGHFKPNRWLEQDIRTLAEKKGIDVDRWRLKREGKDWKDTVTRLPPKEPQK